MIVREYYQKDAPDPILAPETVLTLVHRHVPSAETVTAIDETGGEARVYFIDEALALKVQRPQQLRSWTSLEKEVRFLRQIAADDPTISVPRVVGYGRDDGIEYTLMTRMGGDAAVRAPMPPAARAGSLHELGRTIRRIHAIHQEPLRASGLFPEEYTSDDLRAGLARDLVQVANRFEEGGIGWPFPWSPGDLAERAQARVPKEPAAVSLHTNPGPTHTFVEPETGGFVGLIDFGDAYIGHPAHDLLRWPDPVDREAVLRGYREAGDPGTGFWAYWPVAVMVVDLILMLRRPEARDAARERVISTVGEWGRG